jgi:hypothetical protein
MFATWGSESYTTCTEKVEVESTKKGCVEDKLCMERRFTSFVKVEYMFYMYIVVSIDNTNEQQENKRLKCPLRAKPTQKPLENQEPSYQKGKKTSEN